MGKMIIQKVGIRKASWKDLVITKLKEVIGESTPNDRVKTRLATLQRKRERTRAGRGKTTLLNWNGRGSFKIRVHDKHQGTDRGMTSVKVITDKHTMKDVF
jgi:hypothetical protein